MEGMEEGTLLFLYNADAGIGNAVWDSLHKLVSPRTYACSLCRLTHGLAGPRRQWTEFLRASGRPVRFLHRDEIPASGLFPEASVPQLPAVFEIRGGKARPILGSRELDGFGDLGDLCRAIGDRTDNRSAPAGA